MALNLTPAQRESVSRISGLIVVNAMIFQEVLAQNNTKVKPLAMLEKEFNFIRSLREHWSMIIEEINYFSIFAIATNILEGLGSDADVVAKLKILSHAAQDIVSKRAILRHDLMGRIYHRLLSEQKYLGTYYTTIPAATLICKLIFQQNQWNLEWHDIEQLEKFKVADLTCGTGTLLMASADAIRDNYVSTSAQKGQKVDHPLLHKVLSESILHGYDVLPSAIHLTASTLALQSPQVIFEKMNLFSVPLGGPHQSLGSIEFLKSKVIGISKDLFGAIATPEGVGAKGELKGVQVTMPELDACVINPPFTRSVGGNLLFGSVPEDERPKLQKKLGKWMQSVSQASKVLANSTAGLGPVFVLTAYTHLKDEGRLALILPKALLSGVAWENTRELLRQNFVVEYIVVSYDAERWNFSESTDLSEVLVVARKTKQKNNNNSTCVVNLWHNPRTNFEALTVAHTIERQIAPHLDGQGCLAIKLGKRKLGEIARIPWHELTKLENFLLPVAFAQVDLIRVAYHLVHKKFWLPTLNTAIENLPLVPLSDYFEVGPDRRDIYDGFEPSDQFTPYPAFWGKDKEMTQLAQEPNKFLAPLPQPAKNRKNLRKVSDLWPKAGRILVSEKSWVETQGLFAIRLTEPVLSNVWWTLFSTEKKITEKAEKAIVLWLNSTLGWLMFFIFREDTRGAWLGIKKPHLLKMLILDVEALPAEAINKLATLFDEICHEPLLPLSQAMVDSNRKKIDQAICEVLKLPDLSLLRRMIANEPIVTMKKL